MLCDIYEITPELYEISSSDGSDGFWRKKNTVKFLELKTFQSRNKKQKHPYFLLFFSRKFATGASTDAFI